MYLKGRVDAQHTLKDLLAQDEVDVYNVAYQSAKGTDAHDHDGGITLVELVEQAYLLLGLVCKLVSLNTCFQVLTVLEPCHGGVSEEKKQKRGVGEDEEHDHRYLLVYQQLCDDTIVDVVSLGFCKLYV